MLQFRDVSKRYNGKWALHPLSLDFDTGRTHILIGPSGCGKSTLLRLAVGLVSPDSGTVLLAGRRMSGPTVLGLRRRIGYVIQEGGLFPHLTARENVCLLADYLGWPPSRTRSRLDQLAELTRFPADGLARFPAELSGGQRQRLSLMRALMLDPDLLLLDEPLAALDPMIRSELQQELREVFLRLQKTVLFVTHDMAEAEYFGDTITLLREGHIIQRGSVGELVERPADPFVREFLAAQRGFWWGGES